MSLPAFWLTLPLIFWCGVWLDLLWLAVRRNSYPSLKHVVQERFILHNLIKRELPPLLDVYLPIDRQ